LLTVSIKTAFHIFNKESPCFGC